MKRPRTRSPQRQSSGDESYRGHSIVIVNDERRPRVLIDGRPHSYGIVGGKQFYLDDYAFDRADDLLEVVRRYIDYLEAVLASREATEQVQ